jgi:phosphoribosylanthranilate isomerase
MTRVMVCGARTDADPDLLALAGVDAMGLITEVRQALPCNLTRTQARALARLAPPFLISVLVTTAEDVDEICRLVDCVAPDVVQLHGFNSPEDVAGIVRRVPVRVVKTLHAQFDRLTEGEDAVACAQAYLRAGARAVLVDSYRAGKLGATGEAVAWDLAARLRLGVAPFPLILAGGLTAANVAGAIAKVEPYAVDVLSGVSSDGYLDLPKISEFVACLRGTKEKQTNGR